MPRKILITNDDGVASSGLLAAYEAVKGLGDVYVVAPATQQSAVGRSMTLFEPLRIGRLPFSDTTAYSVNGTPTDSVILGMFVVMEGRRPDLVISGINIGENLSAEAATTSGTIGAALEAANQGIPAIAVSMRVEDEGDKFLDTDRIRDYAAVQWVIRGLARHVLEEGMPPGVDVLNVNVPCDATPDTPVVATRLARQMYQTRVHHRQDPRGRSYYWIDGTVVQDASEGTDLHVMLKKGQISVTPLTLDMTAKECDNELDDVLRRTFGR
jgi:5''/3''-nucleotidase SurE